MVQLTFQRGACPCLRPLLFLQSDALPTLSVMGRSRSHPHDGPHTRLSCGLTTEMIPA